MKTDLQKDKKSEGKYKIEQFPKNKDFDISKLSDYQILIRNNQKKYHYEKEFTCRKCFKKQDISEFYIKDKATGRRNTSCRDCQMKNAGVIEVGKQRFSDKIGDKGFRRCSVCKNIKPLSEYSKQKGKYLGRASNCKDCNAKGVKKLQTSGRKEITDWYVCEYGKRNGITKFDNTTICNLRNEIIENRKPKYFLDNLEFITLRDFAKYIERQYGLPITTTEKRISVGKTEKECKLSESQMRSITYTKGKIQVTDTVNNKVFNFKNTKDPELLKMFSTTTITRSIKSGKPTRITKMSKYKNPCIIKRI